MEFWQVALIALAVAWALQAVGTWRQMRHYRLVLGDISRRFADGHMGAGNARAGLGRGVILILVVGPDDLVRQVSVMEGRSVFASFKALDEFAGLPLDALRKSGMFKEPGRNEALAKAIEQIDRARERSTAAAAPPAAVPA